MNAHPGTEIDWASMLNPTAQNSRLLPNDTALDPGFRYLDRMEPAILGEASRASSRKKRSAKPEVFSLKNILVPIDFSPVCLDAIPWAKFIARESEGTIHLFHVHGVGHPLPMGMVPPARPSRAEVEKKILGYLKRFAVDYHLAGVGVRCHLAKGSAIRQISRGARALETDLIIASTHGHTGWKRIFLGSVAEGIVRHAPCPVLVARHPSTGRVQSPVIRNIVVPFDFSKPARRGLEYAVAFATHVRASLTLLHVVTPDRFTAPQDALAHAASELKQRAVKQARTQLRDFCLTTFFNDLPVKIAVRTGMPAEEICKFARRTGTDLILTATHGRTGLRHVLVGSVAEHIVRFAEGPVLVVPTRRGTWWP